MFYFELFYIGLILKLIVVHAVAKSYDEICSTLTVPCKKSKMVYFTSSSMKNNNLLSLPSRLPVKLIFCFAFKSASSACCLLKYISVIW